MSGGEGQAGAENSGTPREIVKLSPAEWLEAQEWDAPPCWWLLSEEEWAEVLEELHDTPPAKWGGIGYPLNEAESNYVRLDDIRTPFRGWTGAIFVGTGFLIGLAFGAFRAFISVGS